jgi:tyrosine-protein phosphatase YwqE
MSLDVEGSELEVLKGINFSKLYIHIIDVEMNYPDSERCNNVHQLLVSNGYIPVIQAHIDRFYIHKNSPYLQNLSKFP